jgi:hypothetical protein
MVLSLARIAEISGRVNRSSGARVADGIGIKFSRIERLKYRKHKGGNYSLGRGESENPVHDGIRFGITHHPSVVTSSD